MAPAAERPSAASDVIEVQVAGKRRAKESAEAVKVVNLAAVQHESTDLGDVLRRTSGVGVRRTGGLGSDVQFSLNGLSGDQIRFFLDGLPLENTGYAVGIANVPVNLVSRAEIFSGVVPIRFGADALGGAVNLVTDHQLTQTTGSVSYQVGSFGMHRVHGVGNYYHSPTGLYTRVDGFYDRARNDYWVDGVNLVDDGGQVEKARVKRFHDAYEAGGAGVEIGFADEPWAKRLSLRGFYTESDKEIQNDMTMTIPYGQATSGRKNAGVVFRYEGDIERRWHLELNAAYNHTRYHTLDVAECIYDWRGDCGRSRRFPGEINMYQGMNGGDLRVDRDVVLARSTLSYTPVENHAISVSVAPTFSTQLGENRRIMDPTVRDALTARRSIGTLVTGLEYRTDQLDKKLSLIAFGKHYYQLVDISEGGGMLWNKEEAKRSKSRHLGAGLESLYQLLPWLAVKASYEWAIRLPRLDELLGDTVLVLANVELRPERSHNFNFGLLADSRRTRAGIFKLGATTFVRKLHDMIVLFGLQTSAQSYQNLFDARSTGIETNGSWTSPRDIFTVLGNVTYQNFINTSDEGTFGALKGARLPQRPWVFANAEARFDFRDVLADGDRISLVERTNWVGDFYRGWGNAATGKARISDQLTHALVVSYAYRFDFAEAVIALEGHNLSDERVYDFFGLQKPGRSLYAKVTLNYR